MRIVTASGRSVAVGGVASLAGSLLSDVGGEGSVRLARRQDGRRRHVRYAEIARTNPWARAAIDRRASIASRIPLHVFRPVQGSPHHERERVRVGDDGPGAQLAALLGSPADRLSGRRWRRRIVNDALVHAQALVEQVRSGGQLVELVWHPWVDVEWHLSSDGLTIEAFEVPTERRDGLWLRGRRRLGPTRMIDVADAIHFVASDEVSGEAGPVGVSAFASLHATQALYDAAMRFALRYLDNGVFPTGVVELHANATPGAAKATRELLALLHAGVENAGAPVAIAGKWQSVMATPEGAKLLELAKYSREEVAAAFGQPLLGEMAKANRATAEAARQEFVRDVVGDDVAVLESELNAQLVAPSRRLAAAGVWVEGQLAEQLRPDLEARSRALARMDFLTPNEKRGIENYPRLADERADQLILNPGTPQPDGDGREPAEDEE